MQRCVIIGNADITKYELVKNSLRSDDFYVFCDGGLKHMDKLGIKPDLIIGDFDSASDPHMNVETITLPCEKDDTDTFYAVKEAVKRGFEEFFFAGVVGNRFDHTMGNISILLYLDSLGKKGCIIDDYSEMEIVSDKPVYVEDSYSYFSLLNMTGCAKGIKIEGAKYPLDGGEITCDYQYGISNEVLPGKRACICVGEGRLLLVKVF